MSSWNFSYSSSSFMSWSSSTSSSSSRTNSGQPQIRGQAFMRESHSNPSGSATRTTTQNLGQAAIQETRFYDARGRERLPYHNQGQNNNQRFIGGVAGQRSQRQQQQHQQQQPQIARGHVEEIDDEDDIDVDDGFEVEEVLEEPVQNAKKSDKAFKKVGTKH